MTRDTALLNDTELNIVCGGGGLPTLIGSASTIVLPHIPRDNEMLTRAQIAQFFDIRSGLVPLPPRS